MFLNSISEKESQFCKSDVNTTFHYDCHVYKHHCWWCRKLIWVLLFFVLICTVVITWIKYLVFPSCTIRSHFPCLPCSVGSLQTSASLKYHTIGCLVAQYLNTFKKTYNIHVNKQQFNIFFLFVSIQSWCSYPRWNFYFHYITWLLLTNGLIVHCVYFFPQTLTRSFQQCPTCPKNKERIRQIRIKLYTYATPPTSSSTSWPLL